jgi:phosphatidylserine synthase
MDDWYYAAFWLAATASLWAYPVRLRGVDEHEERASLWLVLGYTFLAVLWLVYCLDPWIDVVGGRTWGLAYLIAPWSVVEAVRVWRRWRSAS